MTNRVVLGHRGSGVYGLFISKPGFNVLTATDNNLLFNSNYGTLQIVQAGQVTIGSNSGTSDVGTSNLGFSPVCLTALKSTGRPGDSAYVELKVSYPSATIVRIHRVRTNDVPTNGVINYAIVSVPVNG